MASACVASLKLGQEWAWNKMKTDGCFMPQFYYVNRMSHLFNGHAMG